MKIFLPFHIPKLVKPLPFYIPEAWKRYPFRAEPPRIGHYREYPPRDKAKIRWIELRKVMQSFTLAPTTAEKLKYNILDH